MNKFLVFFCTFFFFGLTTILAQTPEKFILHKVKKGETEADILNSYGITNEQLYEYNPLVEKLGVIRRMSLRIPVYAENTSAAEEKAPLPIPAEVVDYQMHEVQPKETKWRLAYQYGITIDQLETLNPEISTGLKIGQQLRIPTFDELRVVPENDTLYNYYKVLPKEGYFRIEKKLGITQNVLDSLNPELKEKGLLAGMILKIPGNKTGRLKIENDLLVERINLLDSSFIKSKIKVGVLLPFKVNEIEFDSVEDTRQLLEGRNLHTLSLDFYSGVLLAAETLTQKGVQVELATFDTENNRATLQSVLQNQALESCDVIIGPLIPSNFDLISSRPELSEIPKISPLSANPVHYRKNVFQSVTQKEDFRNRMLSYLETQLEPTQNVVIVADSLNRQVERELRQKFPWAITLRPEKEDYLLPELVDSLLVDTLPNKVILETQSFPLIASALSQFNAQNTAERNVQVFTTFRSNAYDNDNISRKLLGGIKFTYPVGFKPLDNATDQDFINHYISRFGAPPNKESVRGYDLALDIMLRLVVGKNLENALSLGETEYLSNRFSYRPRQNEAYENTALFLLTHDGYEVIEIKE